MRIMKSTLVWVVLLAVSLVAQAPPAAQRPPQPGGGQRRAPIQVMTVTSTGWPDGGQIPKNYPQAGERVSPPLAWSNVPDDAQSFVLIVRDLDAVANNGTEILHWMLWNIPGATRSLPEAVPQGAQLPDGTRQISQSGPYYRGPGAPASGPAHHYVFELYAVDGPIFLTTRAGLASSRRAKSFASPPPLRWTSSFSDCKTCASASTRRAPRCTI
jgi:Raf kinase inhibitor-like YbhB/YbcL family protein